MANLNITAKLQDEASAGAAKIAAGIGLIDNEAGVASTGFASLQTIGVGAMVAIAAATAAVVIGFTAFAAGGVKAAMDMEAQMSNIAAVLNATKEEVEPLGVLINDLGLNPNLKVSAVEAADAIEMLARNGLDMTEILDGAAESTVLLANSTGADFATAANIGTDAMAIFNIEAKDMMEAVDGITAVTTASKFGINDYALALAQGGGVAATVGVPFDDFNTTIAAISPLFASGSDAGTSFKNMLTRMANPTDEARALMGELGLEFFDTQGNMKDMEAIVGELNTGLANLTEEQKTSALATMFGSDAMRAAAALAGMTEEEYAALAGTMGETSAADAAATRMDNLAGVMEIIGGVIDSVQLKFGQGLLPILRMGADAFLRFANNIMPKVEAGLETVSTVVESFTGNLEEGMNPLNAFIEAIWDIAPPEVLDTLVRLRDEIIPGLMQTITAVVQPIITAVSQFVSWKDVLIALGIAVASVVLPLIYSLIAALFPIIAVFALVTGAVALLRNAWENDWGGMQTKLTEFWETIARPALEQLYQWLAVNVPVALEALRAWWVDTAWPAISAALQIAWAIIQAIFTAYVAYVRDVFIPVVLALYDYWVNVAWPAISAALVAAWAIIQPVLVAVWDYIVNTIIPTVQDLWNKWVNVWWPAISTALENAWTIILTIWEELGRWINDNIVPWVEFLHKKWVEEIWPAIQKAVEDVWEIIKPIWEKLREYLEDKLPPALEGLQKVFETVMSAIDSAIQPVKTMWDNLVSAVQGFWDWISSHTFKFNISIPDLPDWATPGSPLPIHTAWANFADDMSRMNITPQMDVSGMTNAFPGGGNGEAPVPEKRLSLTLINPQFYGVQDADSLLAQLEGLAA